MSNPICYLCGVNLVYKEYDGTKLLDEDGSKPCFDCVTEDEQLKSEGDDPSYTDHLEPLYEDGSDEF